METKNPASGSASRVIENRCWLFQRFAPCHCARIVTTTRGMTPPLRIYFAAGACGMAVLIIDTTILGDFGRAVNPAKMKKFRTRSWS
jgi:hypothetical protein